MRVRRSPVTEGAAATFTLTRQTRTGASPAALTVPVSVSESGAMLAAAAPRHGDVRRPAGRRRCLTLATVDDVDYKEDSTVAVSPGDSYTVGEPGTATVTRRGRRRAARAAGPRWRIVRGSLGEGRGLAWFSRCRR